MGYLPFRPLYFEQTKIERAGSVDDDRSIRSRSSSSSSPPHGGRSPSARNRRHGLSPAARGGLLSQLVRRLNMYSTRIEWSQKIRSNQCLPAEHSLL